MPAFTAGQVLNADALNKLPVAVGGTVNITPNVAAGSYFRGTVSIVFPAGTFSSTPAIVATAHSSVPGVVMEVTYNNPTASGCDLVLARETQTGTNVSWIAIAI